MNDKSTYITIQDNKSSTSLEDTDKLYIKNYSLYTQDQMNPCNYN
jgi:hypothetical protein